MRNDDNIKLSASFMNTSADKNIPCELISWDHFQALSRVLADKIRQADFRPDMIIGICRGGYLPARLLADYFGILDLAAIKIEHYHGTRKHESAVIRYPLSTDVSGRKILLVDDVSDSGDTFTQAIDHIRQCGDFAQLKTAVLHHKITSLFVPDYYAEKIVQWRWLIYPWAVTEDIASFIEDMSDTASIESIQGQLSLQHDIVVTPDQVQLALQLLSEQHRHSVPS